MISPSRDLWVAIYEKLKADPTVMALVDGVYDKEPANSWTGPKQMFVTKGPNGANNQSGDLVDMGEYWQQIDVWSRNTRRSACDDAVYAVCKALENAEMELDENALAFITVDFWRVTDDPDNLTQHGFIMVRAVVEELA